MSAPDFANILFGGPCNRRCPFCIGKQLPTAVQASNLDLYPLRNQQLFAQEVNRLGIRQVVFTATVTDPLLYLHQPRLLAWLRKSIPKATFSLHTNGVLGVARMKWFNRYDKACISFPSFDPEVYEKMMGCRRVPDLAAILRGARIPVKISCLLTEYNIHQLDSFLSRCRRLGIERVVLRRLYGEQRRWNILPDREPVSSYRGNPVYDYDGMEVTYWNFDTSESTSLNLFADGTLGHSYLLARTPQFEEVAHR